MIVVLKGIVLSKQWVESNHNLLEDKLLLIRVSLIGL